MGRNAQRLNLIAADEHLIITIGGHLRGVAYRGLSARTGVTLMENATRAQIRAGRTR